VKLPVAQTSPPATATATATATLEPPEEMQLLSWNVDGLDDKNLKARTEAVAAVISRGRYAVVFLQEVTPADHVLV